MSVRTSVAPLAASLFTMCSAIAPRAPVIRIVLPERSMLIVIRDSIRDSHGSGQRLAWIHSRKNFVAGFSDEHIVLDAGAAAAFGNIDSRLDGNHHARFQPRSFARKNQEAGVMIAETYMMSGVMGEKRRESLGRDLVAR